MSSTNPTSSSWEPPAPEDLQRLLPQYEISGILGRGGMGAVYKGRQASLERDVAIKVLPETFTKGEDELNFAARFKQEARAMAKLDHPAIISVHDFGETSEGQLYFVMEFVDGMDIHQYLHEHGGKLPQETALAIAAHVLDALEYAHGHGIVHRDIKPANILLNREGRVKIADFGLAKKFGEAAGDSVPALTMTNVAVGTPDFVAPEALDPDASPDHRADLYAVGVMLYQMLTGRLPRGQFKSPSEVDPEIDPRLDEIVSRALQPYPEDRYPAAAAVRADLDRIFTQPFAKVEAGEASSAMAAAVPVTTSVKGAKRAKGGKGKPSPALVYGGIGLAAALVMGLVVMATRGGKEEGVSTGGTASGIESGTPTSAEMMEPPKAAAKPGVAPAPEPPPAPKESAQKAAPERDLGNPVPSVAAAGEAKEATPAAVAPAMTTAAAPTPVPEPAPALPSVTTPEPPSAPDPLVGVPGLAPRLEAYLSARRVQTGELASRYLRGLESRLNQAADAGDLPLAKAFRDEEARVGALRSRLAEPPGDVLAAAAAAEELDPLPEDVPEGLAALRGTWNGELSKIREDLDGKLRQSLQVLETELTRSRQFEQAEAVLAYRGSLGGGHGSAGAPAPDQAAAGGPATYQLFDGKSLDGWRAVPNGTFFSVVDGAIRIAGKPADLYYEGSQFDALGISDFELTMQVKTEEEANSGVFFHCARRADGGYEKGPEFQIANENRDPQKTGSLWRIAEPVTRIPARDGEWFEYRMAVSGRTATTHVDGRKLMEWTQPEDWTPPAERPGARLGRGTFAIQANGGIVWIKDIVLKLPAAPSAKAATTIP